MRVLLLIVEVGAVLELLFVAAALTLGKSMLDRVRAEGYKRGETSAFGEAHAVALDIAASHHHSAEKMDLKAVGARRERAEYLASSRTALAIADQMKHRLNNLGVEIMGLTSTQRQKLKEHGLVNQTR